MEEDIRWQQRFSNYRKAIDRLRVAVKLLELQSDVSTDQVELSKEGLIQRFEYTHELAWKVMKDFAKYQGIPGIKSPRDATRWALQFGLINQGTEWMDMIKSRNLTSHTYDEQTADEISEQVLDVYFSLLQQFESKMEAIRSGEQLSLL